MDDLLKSILEIPTENQNIEFKRLSGDKVVSKIIETIVSMANTDGGYIILGIDDPEKTKLKGEDRIFGIEENIELYDEIGREIQRIIPPISNIWEPLIVKNKYNDKTVAIIKIPKATECFFSINQHVFIRLQKGNKKLSPQEVIKLSYAKGFEKADKELVKVDFDLLHTPYYEQRKNDRKLPNEDLKVLLFKTGLARKNEEGILRPTRAAVLLFAEYPTNLMETKCAIRVYRYSGSLEKFEEVPNLIGKPKTIEGPVVKIIKEAHEYVLNIIESGIEIYSGFITKYKIPSRAIKEAITNAVIHRDYYIKRDIEIKIFEDRIEIESPGLFPFNITKSNIGSVRADGYRNDILVKHLREFSEAPNLDRNEGVQAMKNEMNKNNLFPPIFVTYPTYQDSVKVVLFNEERGTEREKVKKFLDANKYINNTQAREITGITQSYTMSRLFKKWTDNGLILKIEAANPKNIKYKLTDANDINT